MPPRRPQGEGRHCCAHSARMVESWSSLQRSRASHRPPSELDFDGEHSHKESWSTLSDEAASLSPTAMQTPELFFDAPKPQRKLILEAFVSVAKPSHRQNGVVAFGTAAAGASRPGTVGAQRPMRPASAPMAVRSQKVARELLGDSAACHPQQQALAADFYLHGRIVPGQTVQKRPKSSQGRPQGSLFRNTLKDFIPGVTHDRVRDAYPWGRCGEHFALSRSTGMSKPTSHPRPSTAMTRKHNVAYSAAMSRSRSLVAAAGAPREARLDAATYGPTCALGVDLRFVPRPCHSSAEVTVVRPSRKANFGRHSSADQPKRLRAKSEAAPLVGQSFVIRSIVHRP